MAQKLFYETAVAAARSAAAVHRQYFRKELAIRTKSTSFDLLTVADIEAEKRIVSVIRERFPEHNILAEEHQYPRTFSEYTWIVDPLDGTNNFSFGLPIFCVSIALARKKDLLLGVIYDPTRDEMFWAQKGKGAYLNGEKIRVSRTQSLDKSMLITGFYYDRGLDMLKNLEHIKHFFQKNIIGLRRFGSAALDLSYIACGRATGFWEFKLSAWDFAAGALLVEEAGGRITDRDGKIPGLKESFVVASNGRIHEAMLAVLRGEL